MAASSKWRATAVTKPLPRFSNRLATAVEESHPAARTDDVQRVRELLDADPSLLDRGDKLGGTPLHRAVMGSARRVVALLVDRGANIHAIHSTSRGSGGGWGPWDVQAIDLAIFGNNPTAPAKGDFQTARLLVERGATCDLTIAAALGDLDRLGALLDRNPDRIREIRPNGRRPLTAALTFGHRAVARFLLERGADPGWPEVGSPKGASLRIAAGDGDREMVELLLAHGADPHSDIDSGGSALSAAKTPEVRAMLAARAGRELDPYDLVWQNQDDEVIRRVKADPKSADRGCGGVFTAVCTLGKRDLMMRLLEAGIRVPAVLTACRTYVMENLEMFKILLAHGMNPDLPNWQGQTFLHNLCSGGRRSEVTVRSSELRFSWKQARRYLLGKTSTVQHLWAGPPGPTCRIWLSSCSREARQRACPMIHLGPRL
jgi:ankyrin repeat protein